MCVRVSLIKGIYSKAQNTAEQTDNKSRSPQTSQVQGHLSPASGFTAQLYTYTPASTQMWRLIAVFLLQTSVKISKFFCVIQQRADGGTRPSAEKNQLLLRLRLSLSHLSLSRFSVLTL